MNATIRSWPQRLAAAVIVSSVASLCSAPPRSALPNDGPLVKACEIRLTEMGKLARFRVTLQYEITTDSHGRVGEALRTDTNEKAAGFIELDSLATCFREWVLEPSDTYLVSVPGATPSAVARKRTSGCHRKHDPSNGYPLHAGGTVA